MISFTTCGFAVSIFHREIISRTRPYSSNVARSLAIIQVPELSWRFVQSSMRSEDATSAYKDRKRLAVAKTYIRTARLTLPLVTDDSAHRFKYPKLSARDEMINGR
jgi:hypothetical protein